MADETPPVDPVEFVRAAAARAMAARQEAHALHAAGFHSAAVVWAVRATEVLMRDFLLAPYYVERGLSFEQAIERGSRDLGSAKWNAAFRLVAKRYGPFDPALTKQARMPGRYGERITLGDVTN
jgi:hypothetical protein